MKNLRSQLHGLRTSFSNTALHYFDALGSISPTSSYVLKQPLKKEKSSGDLLSGHLDQISKKLKRAQQEIATAVRDEPHVPVRMFKH